jgi:hypothetical protein
VGDIFLYDVFLFFKHPPFWISLIVLALIGLVLIRIPVRNAGAPDAPMPPSAM